MVQWLSADEQRTWRAFLGASRTVERALEAQLQADAGMPHAWYEVLVRLSEADGRSLRMSALAQALDVSRSRLSHAVGTMEERGWVERRAVPGDRRGQDAVLTAEGLAVLQAAAPGHVAAVRGALFDALTPAQQTALRRACEALLTRDQEL